MVKILKKCRICGNTRLEPVIDLGTQCLTGVFPSSKDEKVTSGPLELVRCSGDINTACGLVQLHHSYDRDEMYGVNYGYRSSLNITMINHLENVMELNLKLGKPSPGDLVIDIGSNDGTLLNMYPEDLNLVGIDPTAKKFGKYYKPHIKIYPDFFTAELVKKQLGRKARIVSSIAMFYDLENPIDFAQQIGEILDDGGVWVSEQSYMPVMLQNNSYDTICHEHLEYYSLRQLKWIFDKADLKIIDIELNDVNGGSIKIVTAKKQSGHSECSKIIEKILENESNMGLDRGEPYDVFQKNVSRHRDNLLSLINSVNNQGKKILGYGASTKGNVILQYCGINAKQIPFIAEVNEDKFGKYTPLTLIPIIPEQQARAMKPDYLFVLPWHFKDNFIKRESEYLKNGGKLIFPLPKIEIVD
jgi:hypothetical protein